jgi:PLD-like domain
VIPAETDLPYNQSARAKFVYRLWQDKSLAKKVRIFHRPKGPGSYIHAKVWIIDDELALIGSANVNRRGWSGDSEVMAAIFDKPATVLDPPFAQRLRMRLWSGHLGVDADSVRDGTDPTAWVQAAQRGKVDTYIPFLEASKADAERFPDPAATIWNPKIRAIMDVTGYRGPANVKGVWDNILDPPAAPPSPCRGAETPSPPIDLAERAVTQAHMGGRPARPGAGPEWPGPGRRTLGPQPGCPAGRCRQPLRPRSGR